MNVRIDRTKRNSFSEDALFVYKMLPSIEGYRHSYVYLCTMRYNESGGVVNTKPLQEIVSGAYP